MILFLQIVADVEKRSSFGVANIEDMSSGLGIPSEVPELLDKQQELLNNFWVLISRLQKIEEEIHIEKEILIGSALDNIRAVVKKVEAEKKQDHIRGKIDELKSGL